MKNTIATRSHRNIAPVNHLPYVPSQEPTQPTRNVLRVTGSGRVSASADYAVVSMTMSVTDLKYTGAVDELNRETGVLVRALRNAGIRQENIRTRQYRIGPDTKLAASGEEFLGYRAAHRFEVRIPAKVADIRATYLTLKHEVEGGRLDPCPRIQISFHVRDEEKLAKEALARALEDATGNALTMARTQGCMLENILNVEAPDSGIFVHKPSYTFETRYTGTNTLALTPESFQPREIKVERVASLTFAMSKTLAREVAA